jgi:hypothetical protein
MVDSAEHWHLDKRVPLSLLAAIMLQTAGFGWWAARVENKADNNQTEISRVDVRVASDLRRLEVGIEKQRQEDRAELKEFVRDVRDSLRRIEERLADKADRPRP